MKPRNPSTRLPFPQVARRTIGADEAIQTAANYLRFFIGGSDEQLIPRIMLIRYRNGDWKLSLTHPTVEDIEAAKKVEAKLKSLYDLEPPTPKVPRRGPGEYMSPQNAPSQNAADEFGFKTDGTWTAFPESE